MWCGVVSGTVICFAVVVGSLWTVSFLFFLATCYVTYVITVLHSAVSECVCACVCVCVCVSVHLCVCS